MLEWLRKALGSRRSGKLAADAFAAHDAGEWERATVLLRQLVDARPGDTPARYRLGDALYQLGRAAEALPLLERVAADDNRNAEYQYKLGNALKDMGSNEKALAHYQRALQLDPRHARALNNTGTMLEEQDRLEDALEHYRRAAAADEKLLPARTNLAVLLHRLERFGEATQAYEDLVRLSPGSIGDWCNLGNAYQGLGRYDEAVRCYERALALDPGSADAHYHSGIALLNLGQFEQAEVAARRAADIQPEHAEGWANLGDTLLAQDRVDDALAAYQRGLGLNPDIPEMLNNIGTAYKHNGALETALRYFERAANVSPQFALARVNMATTRYTLGLVHEAIAGFREILRAEPQNAHAARHLLMGLLYLPATAGELFEQHRDFARRFAAGDPPAPLPPRKPRPGGKIRIGYVSSDLRQHPVGYNLLPIIRSHDRNRFEIYLYSSVRQPDRLTRWFREHATAWRSITLLSDEAAAKKVREDEVDILVLLAGRFDDNRPLIARHRAAPVQVSMHDPATSGLEEMDYLVADRELSPRRTAEKFTERVVCLPTFYLHAPMNDVPAFPDSPCGQDGPITFGSFNNPAKITAQVVALWAKVLAAVPGSRLVLKYMGVFAIPSVRARYVALFREHGIGEERLIFPAHVREERGTHLTHYAGIDIALDPFPFAGSTTTFEALWIGVPVVTLQGDRMVARWSSAMLSKVGLSHLVAPNEAEYVEVARRLAGNRQELSRLRRELRDRVARSPLCDEQHRARQLERLYRRMWAIHTARH
jgi:protein O-GlcNAc transferase